MKNCDIFLIFALKHNLRVLVRTASVTHDLCFEQKYENSQKNSNENCRFYSREKSLYVAWACFRNVFVVCIVVTKCIMWRLYFTFVKLSENMLAVDMGQVQSSYHAVCHIWQQQRLYLIFLLRYYNLSLFFLN